ncbi:proteasome subunit beta type-5-like [Argentina anserina]|uniref:proteasome subunit beta type-5-like n=1 Tax=Argentina anserina TaxID=57926 RepID=UPI002176571F|nr:proteasome subunit beta type-5-like [Potentilla anserina]
MDSLFPAISRYSIVATRFLEMKEIMQVLSSIFLYVSSLSQSVKKIIEINPYMLEIMAGGAVDCQFWHMNLGIKTSRIGKQAQNFNYMCIQALGQNFVAWVCLLGIGTMIARWDETGLGLYYVDSEGGRLKGM